MSPFYKILRGDRQKGIEDINQSLIVYENALQTKFFAGSQIGMIDYMLWPWFERFSLLIDYDFTFNNDGQFPKLAAWMTLMEADDVVQKVRVPFTSMKTFMAGYLQGKPDYDCE
jgi:pyrimidodiazepine synthase